MSAIRFWSQTGILGRPGRRDFQLWFSKIGFGVTLRRNSLAQKGIALKDGVRADDL
jgi:hypothetical protein